MNCVMCKVVGPCKLYGKCNVVLPCCGCRVTTDWLGAGGTDAFADIVDVWSLHTIRCTHDSLQLRYDGRLRRGRLFSISRAWGGP